MYVIAVLSDRYCMDCKEDSVQDFVLILVSSCPHSIEKSQDGIPCDNITYISDCITGRIKSFLGSQGGISQVCHALSPI